MGAHHGERTVEPGSGRPDGRRLNEVSTTMVGLQKEFFGKGPTKARTSWAGDDALVCLMGGGFTPVERTLYDAGREETVLAMRYAFQLAMEDRLRTEVERIVERKVIGFMSAAHQDPDIACEIFLLEPLPDDPDSPLRAENRVPAPER
jgi:uncharacterized protein YbcI